MLGWPDEAGLSDWPEALAEADWLAWPKGVVGLEVFDDGVLPYGEFVYPEEVLALLVLPVLLVPLVPPAPVEYFDGV